MPTLLPKARRRRGSGASGVPYGEAWGIGPRAAPHRSTRLLLLVLPLVLVGSGCSLAFVDGPSGEGPAPAEACTRSWVVPILDLAAAAIGVRGVIVAKGDVVADRNQKVAFNAVWAGAFATSSVIGYLRVRRCRAVTAAR